jgi:prepilin-type N-terminal cleavage/methylation domain-containing protein
MGTPRDERGFTLAEVLVAMVILAIALVALLGMLSRGSLNVYAGGGQSKVTAYARQLMEQLRNLPMNAPCTPPAPVPPVQGYVNFGVCFPALPPAGADAPEVGINRNWQIALVPGAAAPNRLWTITVTVAAAQNSGLVGGQNITVQTMRAECGAGLGQIPC